MNSSFSYMKSTPKVSCDQEDFRMFVSKSAYKRGRSKFPLQTSQLGPPPQKGPPIEVPAASKTRSPYSIAQMAAIKAMKDPEVSSSKRPANLHASLKSHENTKRAEAAAVTTRPRPIFFEPVDTKSMKRLVAKQKEVYRKTFMKPVANEQEMKPDRLSKPAQEPPFERHGKVKEKARPGNSKTKDLAKPHYTRYNILPETDLAAKSCMQPQAPPRMVDAPNKLVALYACKRAASSKDNRLLVLGDQLHHHDCKTSFHYFMHINKLQYPSSFNPYHNCCGELVPIGKDSPEMIERESRNVAMLKEKYHSPSKYDDRNPFEISKLFLQAKSVADVRSLTKANACTVVSEPVAKAVVEPKVASTPLLPYQSSSCSSSCSDFYSNPWTDSASVFSDYSDPSHNPWADDNYSPNNLSCLSLNQTFTPCSTPPREPDAVFEVKKVTLEPLFDVNDALAYHEKDIEELEVHPSKSQPETKPKPADLVETSQSPPLKKASLVKLISLQLEDTFNVPFKRTEIHTDSAQIQIKSKIQKLNSFFSEMGAFTTVPQKKPAGKTLINA